MERPGPEVLAWVSAVLGSQVAVIRSLRLGGSPWLLRAAGRDVVLRAVAAERAEETRTEAAAMTCAARAGRSRASSAMPTATRAGIPASPKISASWFVHPSSTGAQVLAPFC